MTSDDSGYRAYLVRLWQTHRGGQVMWRASVEDTRSGERRAFPDLAHLFAFLEEVTGGRFADPASGTSGPHGQDRNEDSNIIF